jgi:hypothetical protein
MNMEDQQQSVAAPSRSARREDAIGPHRDPGLVPAVIGFILAGVGILALGLWLGLRERTPATPQLTLVAPTASEAVDGPVYLLFDVDRSRMRIGPGGWGIGQLHVHAWVNGREIMPAAADIELVGNPSRYRWTLGVLPPGEHTVRVGWSDVRHREVEAGSSEVVHFTVR